MVVYSKTMLAEKLNQDQRRLLQDFFTHCRAVFKDGEKPAWDFWAEKLDKAKIGWNLQNAVAYLAETNYWLDFNKLSKFGI